MAYCRWSTNDYQCDLYVWEGDGGVTIAVAGQRAVPAEPMPPRMPPFPDGGDDAAIHEWVQALAKRNHQVHLILDQSEYAPIGLSRDGGYFPDLNHDEAADLIDELIEEGYAAPDGLADEVRADSRDEAA